MAFELVAGPQLPTQEGVWEAYMHSMGQRATRAGHYPTWHCQVQPVHDVQPITHDGGISIVGGAQRFVVQAG